MSAPGTLTAERVSRHFGSGRHRHTAVAGVSLDVGEGDRVGIVGESGSGKSTFARMLVGLERPSAGTVHYGGEPLSALLATRGGRIRLRSAVQFVAQDTTSSFDPLWTLRQAVRAPARRLLGLDRAAADAEVDATLALLGLPTELAERRPGQVSGGQRQRFALARSLVVSPRLLVCDEVVSALDVSVQGSILNLLKRYCAERGAGLVFVSHGLPATAFIARELAVMQHGEIVERGRTPDILADPQHPYTRHLLRAFGGADSAVPDPREALR